MLVVGMGACVRMCTKGKGKEDVYTHWIQQRVESCGKKNKKKIAKKKNKTVLGETSNMTVVVDEQNTTPTTTLL